MISKIIGVALILIALFLFYVAYSRASGNYFRGNSWRLRDLSSYPGFKGRFWSWMRGTGRLAYGSWRDRIFTPFIIGIVIAIIAVVCLII